MGTFFINYAIRHVTRHSHGTLCCPYCAKIFDPPFRPNPSHVVDIDRRHRSNAQRCSACGKFFTVTRAMFAAAGYRPPTTPTQAYEDYRPPTMEPGNY